MKILKLKQGSDEWLAARARMRTASDAPAMMGCSPYKTRRQLLDEKATGITPEVTPEKQRLFDRGHEIEALARPLAEREVGWKLYPVTVSDDDEWMSASLDGRTAAGAIIWECKMASKAKLDAVMNRQVPDPDYWQVVQQMAVSRAQKLLYTLSDGSDDGTVHLWVYHPDLAAEAPDDAYVIDGDDLVRVGAAWRQFDEDLQSHQPVAHEQDPDGRKIAGLPSLHVEVEGRVITTNIEQFKAEALAVIDAVSLDLQTDQDFADAAEAAKYCKDVEERLKAKKDAALAQTETIEALFRAIDEISAYARSKRLALDKAVKDRRERRKLDIQNQAVTAYLEHLAQINVTLTDGLMMPDDSRNVRLSVADAMKGKRTIESWIDAAHQALTDAKVGASKRADLVRENLAAYRDLVGDNEHLFPDLRMIISSEPAAFLAIVKQRIHEHHAREKARVDAATAAALERASAEKAKPEPEKGGDQPAAEQSNRAEPGQSFMLKVSDINAAIAPVSITAAGLSAIGVEPAAKQGAAKLYESGHILQAIDKMISLLRLASNNLSGAGR